MSLGHVSLSIEKEDSLLRIQSSGITESVLNGADELYLIIGQICDEYDPLIQHYNFNGKLIEKRRMSRQDLMTAIFKDADYRMTGLVLHGEVIQDPLGLIEAIRQEFVNKQSMFHKKRVYTEFAKFVRNYGEAKEHLKKGNVLDSFNSIIHSLQHWANLTAIEGGGHEISNLSSWEQIKQIDPTVYKLLEELISSKEPLKKRIELLLLAFEFAVLSKMEDCVQFILEILKSKKSPWTVDEILRHPEIADYNFEIFPLLDKMVKRSLIKERSILRFGITEKSYSVF